MPEVVEGQQSLVNPTEATEVIRSNLLDRETAFFQRHQVETAIGIAAQGIVAKFIGDPFIVIPAVVAEAALVLSPAGVDWYKNRKLPKSQQPERPRKNLAEFIRDSAIKDAKLKDIS